MSNEKWGTKRICIECGVAFYDLNKDPIKCPKCGAEFDPEEFTKNSFATKAKKARRMTAQIEENEDDLELPDAEIEDMEDDDEELDIIEDASDIGDDSHDMAEVIGNIEKGDLGE